MKLYIERNGNGSGGYYGHYLVDLDTGKYIDMDMTDHNVNISTFGGTHKYNTPQKKEWLKSLSDVECTEDLPGDYSLLKLLKGTEIKSTPLIMNGQEDQVFLIDKNEVQIIYAPECIPYITPRNDAYISKIHEVMDYIERNRPLVKLVGEIAPDIIGEDTIKKQVFTVHSETKQSDKTTVLQACMEFVGKVPIIQPVMTNKGKNIFAVAKCGKGKSMHLWDNFPKCRCGGKPLLIRDNGELWNAQTAEKWTKIKCSKCDRYIPDFNASCDYDGYCMQHLIAYLHICEENMLYPNAIDSIHGKLKLSQDKMDLYATMLKISNNPEKYIKDGALILYQMIPDIEAKTVKEVLEFLEG